MTNRVKSPSSPNPECVATTGRSASRPLVVFDHDHGQRNWTQTGFSPRLMGNNFLAVAEHLRWAGCECVATGAEPLTDWLPRSRLVVIPPPTGTYVSKRERWRSCRSSLYTQGEIEAVVSFLHGGGRLLAFSYRFGDSFTGTNLRDLFAPLGCLLNHDAVIDLRRLRTSHPLRAHFETPAESVLPAWARPGVNTVRWRPMATITILPGAQVQPVALSPGGACVSFDRTQRQISFEPLPLAVAGQFGRGRFILFGGPHAVELGVFGLLGVANNAVLMRNVLQWLLDDAVLTPNAGLGARPVEWHPLPLSSGMREISRVEDSGAGSTTIRRVERQLRRTGILKALSLANWMP